jgi:hypothetical protein
MQGQCVRSSYEHLPKDHKNLICKMALANKPNEREIVQLV